MIPLFIFPDWDTHFFLILHQNRLEALSPFMIIISSYTSWVLVFLLISVFLIIKDKIWGLKASLFALLGIGMNSLVNNVLKEIIARPRPSFNEDIQHLVNVLGVEETNYSFFSAHSSNSFCLAIFIALYAKNIYIKIFIITWAILVAYSRIYVGQHYPIDIFIGALFGVFMGYITYKCFDRYRQNTINKK